MGRQKELTQEVVFLQEHLPPCRCSRRHGTITLEDTEWQLEMIMGIKT
jgi:hypothetical protein